MTTRWWEQAPGTAGDRGELARELDHLAKRLGHAPDGYAGELAELAGVIRAPDSADAEAWTRMDLFTLFGDAIAAAPAVRARRTLHRILSATYSAMTALVALWVLLELTLAFRAYSELLRNPSPAKRWIVSHVAVMRMWEDGFGGYLPKPFDLAHVAGYALATAAAAIVLAIARAWRALAAERTESRLREGLVSVLARAQLVLNQRRLDSPARFTGELSASARHLGEIITGAERAQVATRWAVSSAESTAQTSAVAAGQLRTSVAELGASTRQLGAASDRIEESVRALSGAVARLGDDITGRIATGTASLNAAGGHFADRIGVAGTQAAREIGAIYAEAVAAAAADLEEKMTLIGQQLAMAVGDVRSAAELLGASAGHVTVAVSRLSDVVAEHAGRPGAGPAATAQGPVPDAVNGLAIGEAQALNEIRTKGA